MSRALISKIVWPVVILFLAASPMSCVSTIAGSAMHKPKVVLPATSYPNAVSAGGVDIAVDPMGPDPKNQTGWYTAGICPAKIIINNNSECPVVIDPTQITCTDIGGVTYKPFNAKEASDIVIASEAFKSYAQGAIAGAVFGAALGALTGAALGNLLGGKSLIGRGATYGAVRWGTEGAVVGGASNRAALEINTRVALGNNALQPKVLGRFMKHEGYVFFPAVQIASVEMLVADPTYANVSKVDIPISLMAQKSDKAAIALTNASISPSPVNYAKGPQVQNMQEAKPAFQYKPSSSPPPPTKGTEPIDPYKGVDAEK